MDSKIFGRIDTEWIGISDRPSKTTPGLNSESYLEMWRTNRDWPIQKRALVVFEEKAGGTLEQTMLIRFVDKLDSAGISMGFPRRQNLRQT